jgi:hypothetical protein
LIERELQTFAKQMFGVEGLTFLFEPNLGGAFSNAAGRIRLPKYEPLEGDKPDLLKCLVTHEICHLKYSDFAHAFADDVPGLEQIALIIEDIVVERNLVESHPQCVEYLKRLNSRYVYQYMIRNKDYASMNVDDLVLRKLFTHLSRTSHCPMSIISGVVSSEKKALAQEKFMKLWAHIPEAFRLDTRPRTTKESEDLARKVLEFIGPFQKPSYYFGD